MALTLVEFKSLNYLALTAKQLDKAGFPCVKVSPTHRYNGRPHRWCVAHIDSDCFIDNGVQFWFDSDEDATLFKLGWG